MPLGKVVVRTVVLSPEHGRLIGGEPVLFSDTLEEGGSPNPVPVNREVEAVHEAGVLVTDDPTVTRVINLVLAAVDVAVAVEVLELDVTGIDRVGLGGLHQGVVVLLTGGLRASDGGVNLGLGLPETVGGEAPELAHPHALVVVAGEGLVGGVDKVLVGVVVLVYD